MSQAQIKEPDERANYVSPAPRQDLPPFPDVEFRHSSDDFKVGYAAYWLGFERGNSWFWGWCRGWDAAERQHDWMVENGF